MEAFCKIVLMAIFILFACTSQSFATTYYIDFDGGSNGNNGISPSAAWKHAPGDSNATGNPANTTLIAGDTIKFKGGVVYNGGITVARSGSSASPITFDGNSIGDWGIGRAIIDQQYLINSNVVTLNSDVSYINVRGFELRNAGGYADDDPVVINAANGVYGNGVNAIHNPRPGNGVYLYNNNNNINLSDLYIHHIGIWHSTIGWNGRAVGGLGIRTNSPHNLTIENCEITKSGSGIGLYAPKDIDNVLIKGNYIHDDIPVWGIDVAPMGINSTLRNINITNNRLIDLWSDWTGTPDDPNGSGTTAPHQNYIFFRTAGNPSNWANINVANNLFGETSYKHIGYGGTGSIFISQGPSINIFNNIFARPWSYTGIIFIGYPVPSGMSQIVRIYNNVFLKGSGPQITSAASGNTQLYIKNNIFIDDIGVPANNPMINVNSQPNELDYNTYWHPNLSFSGKWVAVVNGVYRKMSDIKSLGFETHGNYSDPKLQHIDSENPLLSNFKLSALSPLIDSGTDLSSYFGADYDSNTRPHGSAWDIGAYEYVQQGTTPTAKIITMQVTADGNLAGSLNCTLRILNITDNSTLKELNFTTNSSGDYQADMTDLTGISNIRVSASGFLSRLVSNADLDSASQIVFPPLLAGDLDGNNVINSLDFSEMNKKWYLTDPVADLNRDGLVNALDFSLLNKNWQKSGE
jgi:hypothetical protein